MLGIIAWICVWVVLVATFSRYVGALPILLQLPIYLVTGIIWIAPLRPVLVWMELGRWRV